MAVKQCKAVDAEYFRSTWKTVDLTPAGLTPAVTAFDSSSGELGKVDRSYQRGLGRIDRRMGLVEEHEVEIEESYFLAAATFLTKKSTSPKIQVDLIQLAVCPIRETSFQTCYRNVGIFSAEKVRPRTTTPCLAKEAPE